ESPLPVAWHALSGRSARPSVRIPRLPRIRTEAGAGRAQRFPPPDERWVGRQRGVARRREPALAQNGGARSRTQVRPAPARVALSPLEHARRRLERDAPHPPESSAGAASGNDEVADEDG